jgi:hypothetical protein
LPPRSNSGLDSVAPSFVDIFRPTQAPIDLPIEHTSSQALSDIALVTRLLDQCAAAEFGQTVVIQPIYYPQPCAVAVFLTQAQDQPRRLQVLLLTPVPARDNRPTHPRPVETSPTLLQGANAESSDDPYTVVARMHRHLHGAGMARANPSTSQLQSLLANLPEMAWIRSATGEIVWQNQTWFDYVSDRR